MQRLFGLVTSGGFTGQITANSFMKREFGKKVIESFFPAVDLTHVIDTSLAYIPGHGTPTVILLGRNRRPIAPVVRAVRGIKREDNEPTEPARGKVWSAITEQVDCPGSQSEFISVADASRDGFHRHPWSIGGGGAAELKEVLDEAAEKPLGDVVQEIGFGAITRDDDAFIIGAAPARRLGIEKQYIHDHVVGEQVRDWSFEQPEGAIWPYAAESLNADASPAILRFLWRFRRQLCDRVAYGHTQLERGLKWFEYSMFFKERFRSRLLLTFACVATHNNFVLTPGGILFNRHAPVIKLGADAGVDEHLGLLGLLNSSAGAFWMRQVFHDKGGGGIGGGIAAEGWERFLEYDGTKIKQFPLPAGRTVELARELDALARQRAGWLPGSLTSETNAAASLDLTGNPLTKNTLECARRQAEQILRRQIALQEELDWESYLLYALIEDAPRCENPPPISLGQRAFEIVLACKIAAGEEETTWFARHGSMPITEIPADWPEAYRKVVQRRIKIIETNANIGLIERAEYKRRWNTEPWEAQQKHALRDWLLNRLESYFDLDGRMNDRKEVTARGELIQPRLTSVAKVADLARADKDFMQVAEVFTGRMDFDVGTLVGELVAAESVPALPILRYKSAAMDKRAAWERTWDLQRLEDSVDALFEELTTKARSHEEKTETSLETFAKSLSESSSCLRDFVFNPLNDAAKYLAEAGKQKLNLTSDTILKPIQDAAKRAKKAAVGDIPVPPKYTSADFLSGSVWRLRGKLDVPNERWVSFPHCEGEDGTLVIAWAGYDHLQLARAIAERYELAKEQEGRKLVPLLAAIGQLIPWLKQWHNELDPAFGTRMGDYFKGYLAEEAKALGMSVDQLMAWTPPEKAKKKSTTKTRRHEGKEKEIEPQ